MAKWTRRAFVTASVLASGAVVFGVAIRRGDPTDKVAPFMAGENETMLNVWLKIATDNSITVIVPHAEMGQGAHTTLAMMLADELDADWSTVRMIEAPAHEEYANYAIKRAYSVRHFEFPDLLVDSVDGYFLRKAKASGTQTTADSNSVRYTGELIMRVAGASTRATLLQAAATAWRVALDSLRAENSYVVHDASGRRAAYAELAAQAADLPSSSVPVLKSSDQFTIMGTSVPRLDTPSKIDGSAKYGIDVGLPGMKYATVKAAPVFGARVDGIDDSAALGMQGVREIINLGNAVAIVADGYWQAQQALVHLGIKWADSANDERNQHEIFEQFENALDSAGASDAFQTELETGNTSVAFAAASQVISAEYKVPYLAHATMEPMNCTAWVHDGRCELWLGTQNPLGFKLRVARAIGLKPAAVDIHNQYLGGGFGRRSFSDFAEQAARIAVEVSYPVKLIWSREEDIRQDRYRHASVSRFSASLDSAGRPTGWRNQYVEKHFPLDAPHIPYAIDNKLVQFVDSRTHVPWGFWRSVDKSLHTFFTESFIDELAVAAGRDPYVFRRDLLADEPRLAAVLECAAEKSGWGNRLPATCGRGIAVSRGFGSFIAQVVEVEVNDQGVRVCRVVCAVDAGFAVHPDGIRAQMEGGIIFGLTAALYGNISIRQGAVEQSNFHDYQMMRMAEAPLIETHILNSGEPIGGAGEAGLPPVAPALANAIFDATGQRIRELPIKHFDFSQLKKSRGAGEP